MKYEYLNIYKIYESLFQNVLKILAIVNQNKTIILENIGSFPFN